MSEKLRNINYDIDKLPTMPVVAMRMVELINSPRTSAEDLAKVVSGDAAVSARVLKIANSSFYCMSRQVKTLPNAIVILGEKTLKNLVMAASMRGMHQQFGSMEKMLWEDSMVCALGARFLARKLAVGDPEEAFLGGLFRHVGKVVLNNQDPQHSQLIARLLQQGGTEPADLERQQFGITHGELGALVLEHWNLSQALSLVALHHQDMAVDASEDQRMHSLVALVNIASEFPRLFGIFGPPPEEIDPLALAELPGARQLGLSSERLAQLVEEFQAIFEESRDEFLS